MLSRKQLKNISHKILLKFLEYLNIDQIIRIFLDVIILNLAIEYTILTFI